MKDSITLGVISGTVSGAAGGKKFSHTKSDKKAKVAAVSGAILGGLLSYFIHGSLQKRDAEVRKRTLFNLENFGVTNTDKDFSNEQKYFFPTKKVNKKNKRTN